MVFKRQKYFSHTLFVGLFFVCKLVTALEFEPGTGVAFEYTDNAELAPENTVDELITVAYVGARISEDQGSLKYDATSSFNKQIYTQNTFEDQQYFNLAASADWEMLRDRFYWRVRDSFGQRTTNVLNANTPDNLQDTNVFTLGADIRFPISARQNFSLLPEFKQYYYEQLNTDNKQYSLAINWAYQIYRANNVGLNFSTRNINYVEQGVADVSFTRAAVTFSGQRARSNYSINLGSTSVSRDVGGETTGFFGSMNWLANLSSYSTVSIGLVTELTDTSSASTVDFLNDVDVQVTADVVRNSSANLRYQRKSASFKTSISAKYSEVDYSDRPLDQVVRSVDILFDYPLSRLLSSGAYAKYNRIKQLDTDRIDDRYTLGGKLNYRFSRKLSGEVDLKYRIKESTLATEEYDEYTIYASLVYGFGHVRRPTRSGGL